MKIGKVKQKKNCSDMSIMKWLFSDLGEKLFHFPKETKATK